MTSPASIPVDDDAIPLSAEPPAAVRIRTLPLLAVLLAFGTIVLIFALRTVHRLDPAALEKSGGALRTRASITYWLDHGYFASYGLLVRPSAKPPGSVIYKSSTGGHLVTGYLVEKMWVLFTGKPNWRLLAVHNQVWTLLVAAMIGVLAFRLAERLGAHPLHALVLALSVEAVHFTFPDNLALYYEMNGRPYWLFFAVVFLIFEERLGRRQTRLANIAQATAAFLLMYMEYVAGVMFIVSFVLVTLLLDANKIALLRRLALTAVLPALLALGVYGMQRSLANGSDLPTDGSDFLFRTGLDGSSTYYGDHLDIANGREVARLNFPYNRPYLFRWKWLFFAGAAAVVSILIAAMRGRVPGVVVVSLLSLLGAYLLYAALFSQAVTIHPYLFDLMLFTPLVLALFAIAPATVEAMTHGRGIAVAAVFFLAAWVSMVQLRRYAMQYPKPPAVTSYRPEGTKVRFVTAGLAKIGGTMPQFARSRGPFQSERAAFS